MLQWMRRVFIDDGDCEPVTVSFEGISFSLYILDRTSNGQLSSICLQYSSPGGER